MSVNEMFYPKDKEFTKAEKRAFAREELVYNVTEDILVLLEDMGVSKKDLANKLGKSPSFVTQVLSGARNMTLGTLSDICFAIEVKPSIRVHRESAITKLNAIWKVEDIPETPKQVRTSTRVVQSSPSKDFPWKNAA